MNDEANEAVVMHMHDLSINLAKKEKKSSFIIKINA